MLNIGGKWKRFVCNILLLGTSALLMRMVAVAWNAWVSARVGAEVMGLFGLVMSIYGISVTVATSGISLAVTRLVAAALAEGDRHRAAAVMRHALMLALLFGGGISLLLLLLAPQIARYLLGDLRLLASVRALGISMLPIALSSALSGYFTAVRHIFRSAAVSVAEQGMRMLLVFLLLAPLMPRGIEYAALALVLAGAIAEVLSFLLLLLVYLCDRRRALPRAGCACDRKTAAGILHISLPIALSAYLRSGLGTVEHLLIPPSLMRGGASREEALAAFGILSGMALPLVLFPMALVSAAAGLLLPEFAERKALGKSDAVRHLAERSLHLTLLFGIGCAALLFLYADRLGTLIYHSQDAGRYIRLLSPVLPVMFADHVTDAILKGLGEQVSTMWINIADSFLSILLVLLLLPPMGVAGYAVLIILTELFNFAFSFGRLYVVTRLRLDLLPSLLVPLLSAVGAATLSYRFFSFGGGSVVLGMIFTALAYLLPLLILSYLRAARESSRPALDKRPKNEYNTNIS